MSSRPLGGQHSTCSPVKTKKNNKNKNLIWSSHGHTHSAYPPTAELRLNGLSGIILRLIRAQWLCIIFELCVTQNQSSAAVICETCRMCRPDRQMYHVMGSVILWLLLAVFFIVVLSLDFIWGFYGWYESYRGKKTCKDDHLKRQKQYTSSVLV